MTKVTIELNANTKDKLDAIAILHDIYTENKYDFVIQMLIALYKGKKETEDYYVD